MKKLLYHSILFLFLVSTTACVQEFTPDIPKYKNMLVVDGFISNENTSYSVQLSRSVNDRSEYVEFVSNATVNILCSDGTSVALLKSSTHKGLYETPKDKFVGQIGKSYKVYIKVDGKEYESDFTEMIPTPEIDLFYYTFIPDPKGFSFGAEVEFNVAFQKRANQSNYILWETEEAWKFELYKTEHFFQECYQKSKQRSIVTYDLSKVNEHITQNHTIHTISSNDDHIKLGNEYVIYAKQYGITKEAFTFYNRQRKQLESQGSLYDKVPITILGNITCTTTPDEVALGYFRVSSIVTGKIKLYNKDFPFDPKKQDNCGCFEYNPFTDTLKDLYDSMGVRYEDTIWLNDTSPRVLIVDSLNCTNCSFNEGTPYPPDFWIDEKILK